MSVRLKDIADACGIDVSTVSRALADSVRVSEKTRLRVKSVAAHMGYVPNPAARSLVGARTHTIWLILGGLEDPFQRQFARSANVLLHDRGYDLSVLLYDGDPCRYPYLLGRLNAGLTDGALVFPPCGGAEGDDLLCVLKGAGFPLVFVDRHPKSRLYPCVTTDNGPATQTLIEMLLHRGVQRFVLLMRPGGNTVNELRCMVALDCLGRAGHPFVLGEGYSSEFAVPGESIGVIASSQQDVQRFLSTQASVRSGSELHVALFDQWEGHPYPVSSVTVCRQDFPAMARQASLKLLAMLDGGAMTPGITRIAPLAFECIENTSVHSA